MSWIKHKAPATPPKPSRPREVHVSVAFEERIADFLAEHGRLVKRRGRQLMHFTGTTHNHDGSTDFTVRSRIRYEDGSEKQFDSHVRLYATDHLRLIR